MRLPPADVLLSWPTPNYENPVTRGSALIIINAIFVSIAVITVVLRLYTRTVIKRWFGVDDVFIIVALVGTNPGFLHYRSSYVTDIHSRIGRSGSSCKSTIRMGMSSMYHWRAEPGLTMYSPFTE
jgi:hypothetical protein